MAQAKPKTKEVKRWLVKAVVGERFCRAGMCFSHEGDVVDLTAAQIEAIKKEPKLSIEETTITISVTETPAEESPGEE